MGDDYSRKVSVGGLDLGPMSGSGLGRTAMILEDGGGW